MQIVKKGLKKEKEGTMVSKIAKVLMAYRTTPQSTTGVSPSELLQGRRIRTRLDLLKPSVTERVEQHQLQQKISHDGSARRRFFEKGETVYAQNFGTGQKWMLVTGPVSFMVRLQDGRVIRRHQDHLRRRIPDVEPEKPAEADDIPEILIDAFPLAPSPPVTHSSEDGDSASGNSEESTISTDATESRTISDNTTGTATSVADAQNNPGSSGMIKRYPKRKRKQPDWYQNY